MKSLILISITLLITTTTYSHEGHNKTPGSISAPHGGKIKGTSQLYIELVSDSNGIKLYPMDHDLKSISPKEIKIKGTITFPKNKNKIPLSINPLELYFESKVDSKGSHRYTVELNIIYKGKTENINFNVEPQE